MSYSAKISITAFAALLISSCAQSPESFHSTDYTKTDSSSAVYASPETQSAEKERSEFTNTEDSDQADEKFRFGDSISKVVETSAASLTSLDSSHLFIRTADVKCRVNEVAQSTYEIEDAVTHLGGYISDTKLSSSPTWQQQVPVSEDSAKQITKYNVSNYITIRVPSKKLDSLLRALVPLVNYMDYRNVSVNDITLEQLSTQLEQKRLAKYNNMILLRVVDQTNKPDKIMDAAEAMLAKQIQADNAYLESLKLQDRVQYATVNLQIYQPETTVTAMILRQQPVEGYDAGIGVRITSSLYTGWKGFSYFLSFIALLWPLWLIGAGVWITLKWQIRKRAKIA